MVEADDPRLLALGARAEDAAAAFHEPCAEPVRELDQPGFHLVDAVGNYADRFARILYEGDFGGIAIEDSRQIPSQFGFAMRLLRLVGSRILCNIVENRSHRLDHLTRKRRDSGVVEEYPPLKVGKVASGSGYVHSIMSWRGGVGQV